MFKRVYKKNIFIFSLVALLALAALPFGVQLHANAQITTCPTFVAGVAQSVAANIEALQPGQAYYGNAALTALLQEGSTASFKTAGDHAALADLKKLTAAATSVDTKTWGVAVLKLRAGISADSTEALIMVLLGQGTLTNLVDPKLQLATLIATNRNKSTVNLYAAPDTKSALVGTLSPAEKVGGNGRTTKNDWVRVLRSGTPGWVQIANVQLDKEIASLAVTDEKDLSPLYAEPMQSITLETPASSPCKDAPNGLLIAGSPTQTAHMLINGAALAINGAAFITASGDALTITSVQNRVTVSAAGKTVTLLAGQSTTVPLDTLTAKDKPSDPSAAAANNAVDLVNSLLNGQSYNGAGSTTAGAAIRLVTPTDAAVVNDPLRLDVRYTGDASTCPQTTTANPIHSPQDVVLAIEASDRLSGAALAAEQAAVAQFITQLNPQADQFGVVAFNANALPLSPFGTVLDRDALQGLTVLQPGSTPSAQNGLSAALNLIKQSTHSSAAKTIVLLSSGTGDPKALQTASDNLKNDGIRLITIAIGTGGEVVKANRDLLAQLTPDKDDALIAANAATIRPALQQVALSLTHAIAVRNLTVTYTLDSTHYQLNDDLLALSGGTRIDQNTVSWKLPLVYDSQTVDFPLLITPLSVGSSAPGSAKLFYETCAAKVKTVTSEAITAPVLAAYQTAADPAHTVNALSMMNGELVLHVGSVANGLISAFGMQTWLVVSKAEQVLSVITSGTSGALSPTLSGATALYTLRNYDGKQRDLSVFYVPKAGVGVLDINSTAADANGAFTLSIESGMTLQPALALTVDGERVPDHQTGEGRLYNIVNSKGDGHLITVVFDADDPIATDSQLPFTVISLDGKAASTLYSYLDKAENRWVSLQLLHGGGPYYVVTAVNGVYRLGVESENTLSSDRGALKVGETRSQVAKNSNAEVFSYTLTVPDSKRLSLVLSGGVTAARLNASNSQQVAFASQLATNNFRVQSYDLQPGDYTVYLQTAGNFEIGVTEGDTAASLKGPLLLGQTRQEVLGADENFAAYRLILNANNPLTDGSLVTINLFGQNVEVQNVYIESDDNQRSEVSQTFVDSRDRSKPQLFSVQTLKGSAPYRVRVNGLSQYTIHVDAGDLLSNNKGPLIIGQTARDSSQAPAVLFYNLIPQLGKQLVEGDVITVNFTPQITDDQLFQSVSVSLQNGAHQVLTPDKTYVPYQSRQFVSVYTLVGQPPYRLTIPNIGAYTLGLTINDTLDLDQGTILLGATQQDRTTGPQIIGYTFDAPDNQNITVKMTDTRKARFHFEPHLVNADGVVIPERRAALNQSEGSQTVVYVLHGHGPYHLTFEMDGIYEVSLKKGDVLTLFQGTFFVGDAETVDAGKALRIVTYALNLKADQTITIDLRGATDFALTSPLGDLFQPDAALYPYDNGSFGRIEVHHVRLAGTYELAFSQIGQYTLRITDGDALTVNKGNVFLGVTESDKLGNDIQSAQYTLHADPGQTITVRASIDAYAKAGRTLQDTKVLLVDANGIPLSYQSVIKPGGGFIYVYQAQGKAPYTLTFTPERDSGIDQGFYAQQPYTLRVVGGDDLNVDKGVLSVDTPNASSVDKDTLRRPSYTLPDSFKAGDSVSLSVSRDKAKLFVQGTLTDADNRVITSQAVGTSDKGLIESWQLSGKAPYHFAFNISADYIVTLSKGNLLVTDQGALAGDKPVTATLKAPASIAAYSLDGKEGDTISLQVKVGGSSEVPIDLRDASGAPVFPQAAYFDRGTELYLVKLTGSAPYRLLFPTGNQSYTVTLSGSDVLSAQFGKLPHNPAKSDDPKFKPTVVTSKMAAPARVAFYSIEGKDGDVITLQIALKGGGSSIDPTLINQAGETLDAAVKLQDGSSFYRVYKLRGDGPYTVSFATTSDHDMTLTDGDVLRADAGALPTGKQDKPFSNTLKAPAKIAVHQLDVTAGQLLTFQLNAGGKQIVSLLRDGSGAVIAPEVSDFQNGNNVSVYILSGSGPYTVEFPASGQYTASVMAGDLIRLDNGIATFGQAIKATLPAPARVGIFTVDGKRDQLVTVAVQANGATSEIEFRDANGKLWLPIFQFAKSSAIYNVYQLGGPPPYTVNFGAQQFTLTVSDGNVVRADQGALTLGQKITNKLTAPAQVAVYTIDGKSGDLVSVQLQVSNRAVTSEMRDTDGKLLQRIDTADVNNTNVSVYTLSGKPPYHIEFAADGQYNVTASIGNALRADLGKVALGTLITSTLPAPAQVAIYTIDAQPKQVLSVELQVGSQAAPSKLTDADGNELTPDAQSQKGNMQHSIYTLSGIAPYTLTFKATSQYKLTISNGNVLRKDQGVVRFGNTVTDTLKAPAEIAVYLIDGHVNQVMSVKVQDNGQPLNSQLRDANGVLLQPTGRATANSATYDVYTLSAQPPYTLTFSPTGRYSLTLTEGTIFNAALGEVPFGTSVTNTLQVPAHVAVYTLNTSANQVISAQISTQGSQAGFVNAVLFDKDGNPIVAQTRIFSGTNIVTYIYTLSAPGPYTFSFEATGQYMLLFTRGDTSIVKLTQFPTATPTPTPIPTTP